MCTWMNATPASAQDFPPKVQSTDKSSRTGVQAAARARTAAGARRRIGVLLLRIRRSGPSLHSDLHPPIRATQRELCRASRVDRGARACEQHFAMNGSLNYIDMVTHGGLVVTSVLVILVLSSLASWTIIFRKVL